MIVFRVGKGAFRGLHKVWGYEGLLQVDTVGVLRGLLKV